MNEVEEFWEFVARERKVLEQLERAEDNISMGLIEEALSEKVRKAVTLRNDFEKIGNMRAASYWQGYGDGIEEIRTLVVRFRNIAEVLEQAKKRLEEVKDRAVLRKEVDMEIDLAWSIAEIDEAIRRLRA